MIKTVFVSWAMLMVLFASLGAEENFPREIESENVRLVYNGSGVREKFFLDLYRVALYLPEPSGDAEKIVNARDPQAIRIVILSSLIGSKRMKEGIRKGFERSTGGNTASLKGKITRFIAAFDAKIVKGDRFTLLYLPDKGVEIFKNGTYVDTIEGDTFKKALFGIWLGKDPVQRDLKKAMLGG